MNRVSMEIEAVRQLVHLVFWQLKILLLKETLKLSNPYFRIMRLASSVWITRLLFNLKNVAMLLVAKNLGILPVIQRVQKSYQNNSHSNQTLFQVMLDLDSSKKKKMCNKIKIFKPVQTLPVPSITCSEIKKKWKQWEMKSEEDKTVNSSIKCHTDTGQIQKVSRNSNQSLSWEQRNLEFSKLLSRWHLVMVWRISTIQSTKQKKRRSCYMVRIKRGSTPWIG